MSTMLLVPLEDIVVFPNMNVTLTVDVGAEERVLLVPRHENDYAGVGVVAEVTDRVRLPGGARTGVRSPLNRRMIVSCREPRPSPRGTTRPGSVPACVPSAASEASRSSSSPPRPG